MKRLRQFAVIAAGLFLAGGFLAFQTLELSPEEKLQIEKKNADFTVIPIETYTGKREDLPVGTKKFSKVRVSAKTKVSSEQIFLKIPK